MAHQIQQMFSVKQTPWHKLGHIVNEAPNAQEAIKLAGLDWKVEEKQLLAYMNDDEHREIKTHKLLIRSDSKEQLGVVGKGYTPLQNEKAFEFFNPFVESGLASFETAGCLAGGRRVWVLAQLNKAPIDVGGGDTVRKMLLLSNGHDGTMSVRVGFTPIRVVCANTLAAAIGNNNSNLIRITHGRKVSQSLDAVQSVVNAADAKFEATAEQYKSLAKTEVNQSDVEKYINIIFKDDQEQERKDLSQKKNKEAIMRLFETGYGSDLKSAKGTMWGLYNSVTQFIAYERGSDKERLNQQWFGAGMNLNKKAFEASMRFV